MALITCKDLVLGYDGRAITQAFVHRRRKRFR